MKDAGDRASTNAPFSTNDQLATQMLQVSGVPDAHQRCAAAYRNAAVVALALKKIDPELPRKVAESFASGG